MEKIKLIAKRDQHFYETPEGTFPSATTILSLLNKPALTPWAVKMTVSYLSERLDDIKSGKLELTHGNVAIILEEAKRQHRTIATKAAQIGTDVHMKVEDHVNGILKDADCAIEKELKTVQKSYLAYLKWESEQSFSLIGSEVPIYSTIWGGYGGTLDMVAYLDGKAYMIDLKTSSGIYDEYAMQIAAYRYAYAQRFDVPIEGMGILRLDKQTGKYEWREYSEREYRKALKMFGHVCRYWHLKNDS
jgi:hypothetical protein